MPACQVKMGEFYGKAVCKFLYIAVLSVFLVYEDLYL